MGATVRRNSLNLAILKLSGLFGGLQVTGILCSVVRSKLVAVWIGAAGMGLFGIFNTAIEMICSLSMFGLRESAVRNIAQADASSLPKIVKVVRRWAMMLGVVGMLLTLCCSGLLSRISFDTASYTWAFALLSIIVFTNVMNGGERAVFQGLRRYRKLAYCSMAGTIGGLAVSVPMFYYWRIDSVVPSIMAYGIITWLAMGVYRERVDGPDEELSLKATVDIGRKMLSLGFYLTVTGFVANAISYVMMAYLNNYAGTDAAGYYQAGFTLVNRYVGLVFTAISMEYYPRLSAVAAHRRRVATYVTNQLFIAMAMLVPVVTVFICCSDFIVKLLYRSDFVVIVPFVIWAAAGTVFRGISWCMAFVILAKGDGKAYLATETLSGVISVALNILLFRSLGFAGLGLAYVLWYLCYTLIVGVVYSRRYGMRISREFWPFGGYSLAMCLGAAWTGVAVSPYLALPFAVVSAVVSFRVLRRKLM